MAACDQNRRHTHRQLLLLSASVVSNGFLQGKALLDSWNSSLFLFLFIATFFCVSHFAISCFWENSCLFSVPNCFFAEDLKCFYNAGFVLRENSFISTRWWEELFPLNPMSIPRSTGWSFGPPMRSVPSPNSGTLWSLYFSSICLDDEKMQEKLGIPILRICRSVYAYDSEKA